MWYLWAQRKEIDPGSSSLNGHGVIPLSSHGNATENVAAEEDPMEFDATVIHTGHTPLRTRDQRGTDILKSSLNRESARGIFASNNTFTVLANDKENDMKDPPKLQDSRGLDGSSVSLDHPHSQRRI